MVIITLFYFLSYIYPESLLTFVYQVIHRLGIEAPKKSLVENYLIEIARNYHVPYEPDPTALMVSDTPCIACPPYVLVCSFSTR